MSVTLYAYIGCLSCLSLSKIVLSHSVHAFTVVGQASPLHPAFAPAESLNMSLSQIITPTATFVGLLVPLPAHA